MRSTVAITLIVCLFVRSLEALPTNLDEADQLIQFVNSNDFGWKAGVTFEGDENEISKQLLGVKRDKQNKESVQSLPILFHRENENANFDETKQFSDVLFGSLNRVFKQNSDQIPLANIVRAQNQNIPKEFDARQAFPECAELISSVRDQSACGSCWAIAVASAASDRLCIASKGRIQKALSTSDILSCCGPVCGAGCNGGYPSEAWRYWVRKGIVSGGEFDGKNGHRLSEFPAAKKNTTNDLPVFRSRYSKTIYNSVSDLGLERLPDTEVWSDSDSLHNDVVLLPSSIDFNLMSDNKMIERLADQIRLGNEIENSNVDDAVASDSGLQGTCWPYDYEPCQHHTNGSRPRCSSVDMLPTPECRSTCVSSYKSSFESDKTYARVAYRVLGRQQQIQLELMRNGPLTVSFEVFKDFLYYKGGVYKATVSHVSGGHATKLIGWGEEDGKPYWLLQNSWNSDWGENGYAKFIRGENHCFIESEAMAAIPRLKF